MTFLRMTPHIQHKLLHTINENGFQQMRLDINIFVFLQNTKEWLRQSPLLDLQKLYTPLCKGYTVFAGWGKGENDTVLNKRLQIQTFPNQRSNALNSANLAPAVNSLEHPHTDLGEWKNAAITVSLWNPRGE